MLNDNPRKFSIFYWLSSRGFKQNLSDLRDFTHPVSNAKVKLFILDKVKWMSIWDSEGNRMATLVQPFNAKDMTTIMNLTRVLPVGVKHRVKTEQNDYQPKSKFRK